MPSDIGEDESLQLFKVLAVVPSKLLGDRTAIIIEANRAAKADVIHRKYSATNKIDLRAEVRV